VFRAYNNNYETTGLWCLFFLTEMIIFFVNLQLLLRFNKNIFIISIKAESSAAMTDFII